MTREGSVNRSWNFGLDTWAVVAAFLLALAVRLGLLAKIPW